MQGQRWEDLDLHTGDRVAVRADPRWWGYYLAWVDHLDRNGRPYVVFDNQTVGARYLAAELVNVVERAADRRAVR